MFLSTSVISERQIHKDSKMSAPISACLMKKLFERTLNNCCVQNLLALHFDNSQDPCFVLQNALKGEFH